MTNQTYSESLFEQFCNQNQIAYERIPSADRKTPDFRITIGTIEVICEVKQIDMNNEEKKQLQQLLNGQSVATYVPNRLQKKLKSKSVSRQLREAAESGVPTIVVIYNNVSIHNHTAHQDVIEAMFGEKTYLVTWQNEEESSPNISDPFFGGKRTITPEHNTSVSAVAILENDYQKVPRIRVYHNPFAKINLKPQIFRDVAEKQFAQDGNEYVQLDS